MQTPQPITVTKVSDAPTDQQAEPRSDGARQFVVNVVVTLACPCLPAAQVASAVGRSYVLALLAFAALYLSSGVAYWFAAHSDDTFVEGTSVASAYGMQSLAFICGPFFAFTGALYRYCNARWSSGIGTLFTTMNETDKELSSHMKVSDEAVIFISAFLFLNVVFAVGVLVLLKRLGRRTKINIGEDTDCLSLKTIFCCASCSLMEMVWTAKDTASKSAFYFGPIDELPAFDGTVDPVLQPVACPA